MVHEKPHAAADERCDEQHDERHDRCAPAPGRLAVYAVIRVGTAAVIGRTRCVLRRTGAGFRTLLRHAGRCRRLFGCICERIDGHGLLGILERLPALSARRIERRKVDAAVRRGAACVPQLLGQRGEHLGLVAHAGLLNGRTAERAELAPCIGQLPAAFLAKHGYFLL